MHQRRIESFLIRILIEERTDTPTNELRGRVQHIGSGIEEQFESVHDLLRIVRLQSAFDESALPQRRDSLQAAFVRNQA